MSTTITRSAAQPLPERIYSPEPLFQRPWKMLKAIAADVWAGRVGVLIALGAGFNPILTAEIGPSAVLEAALCRH